MGNRLVIVFDDGRELLLSYGVPVAGTILASNGEDVTYVRTDRSYSRTTSKHINSYLTGVHPKDVALVSQERLSAFFGIKTVL